MWTDNIKEWTKISYNDCIRVAKIENDGDP